MTAPNATPALSQVTPDPSNDLTAQPGYVDAGVVAPGVLTLRIGGAADVNNVDEGVGVAEVVEELVAQTFALVGAGDKTGDIQQLDGDTALAVVTGTIVGAASVGNIMAGAGAVDLQVAYGALRVDGGESASASEGGSAENSVVKCDAAQCSATRLEFGRTSAAESEEGGEVRVREVSWRRESAQRVLYGGRQAEPTNF